MRKYIANHYGDLITKIHLCTNVLKMQRLKNWLRQGKFDFILHKVAMYSRNL